MDFPNLGYGELESMHKFADFQFLYIIIQKEKRVNLSKWTEKTQKFDFHILYILYNVSSFWSKTHTQQILPAALNPIQKQAAIDVFCKKVFLEIHRKHLCQSLFFNKVVGQPCDFIKKETLAQVFSCDFCEISKNIFSYRTPPLAASTYPHLWFQRYELERSFNNHSTESRVWLIAILSFTESGVRFFLESGAWRWMNKD